MALTYIERQRQRCAALLGERHLFGRRTPTVFPLLATCMGPRPCAPVTTLKFAVRYLVITRAHDMVTQPTCDWNGRLRIERHYDNEPLGAFLDQPVFEVRSPGHDSLYITRASFSILETSITWSATSFTASTCVMTRIVLK